MKYHDEKSRLRNKSQRANGSGRLVWKLYLKNISEYPAESGLASKLGRYHTVRNEQYRIILLIFRTVIE